MAVRIRNAERIPLDGTIVHSDRGTQYCSKLLQSRLNELNMRSSMSEVGLELGRGRGISNLDKKARITRPAPLI